MQGKVDSRAMREVNRSILLDMIRRSGRMSRADLAKRSALTKPTVSAIVEDLIAQGVVSEVGLGESVPSGGRRARLLEFNESSAAYLGIRFGVHTTRVAVADARGAVRAGRRVRTPLDDPHGAVEVALGLVDDALLAAEVPRARLQGVGVAVGGLVDCQTGSCVLSPNLGWRDFALRGVLQERLGLPVTVSNVADAAARAEGRLGVAQGSGNYVWLYLGTGIGAGIVVAGQVLSGHRGFSGELGHCRVGSGGATLEELASGRALGARARRLSQQSARHAEALGPAPGSLDLIRLALAGDAACQGLLAEVGGQLGLGVSHLVHLLNPELVVVGGPLMEAGALLLEPLRQSLEAHALQSDSTRVMASELGEDAATAGAVLSAMDHSVQSYRIVALAPPAIRQAE